MATIEIYSSEYCPFCMRAKALLSGKGVDFTEIKVDGQPEKRAEMRSRAGGVNTVPQIFIDGESYGGCDDLYALEAKGALDALIGKAT